MLLVSEDSLVSTQGSRRFHFQITITASIVQYSLLEARRGEGLRGQNPGTFSLCLPWTTTLVALKVAVFGYERVSVQ